jgi:xanthine phosphoribosyltransferase
MKKRTVTWAEHQGLVSKICRDITVSGWRPDYVVGLTRGGLLSAVMISHYLEVPCETLKVSLRDENFLETNCWMAEDAFGHEIYDPMSSGSGKKNILIVDDINDQGTTINWILKDWQSSCFPDDERWQEEIWNNNVRFAVLFDNLASKAEVPIDYVGEEINKAENDVWIDFPFEDWWMK